MASATFSASVDNILHLLRPQGSSQTRFPAKLDPNSTRMDSEETLHKWYSRLVSEFCQEEPTVSALEENIAVFIALFWDGKRLVGANMCTLVTTCDLEEYFLERPEDCEEVYLRLDFDYGTLGHPFSHPIPHLHILGNLSPRFSLEVGRTGNVVMDYFDFLYRHYAPEKWRMWAESVWNKHYIETQRPPQENPFRSIMDAFADSQIDVLRKHSDSVQRLKRVLRERKDELFNWCMDVEDRALVQYPD